MQIWVHILFTQNLSGLLQRPSVNRMQWKVYKKCNMQMYIVLQLFCMKFFHAKNHLRTTKSSLPLKVVRIFFYIIQATCKCIQEVIILFFFYIKQSIFSMFILNAYIWQNTIDTRQHTLKKSIDVFKLSAGENSGINTKDVCKWF